MAACGWAFILERSEAARAQAPPTPDRVQMTWTKEKLVAEKHRNKDATVSGFKDLFSLKP